MYKDKIIDNVAIALIHLDIDDERFDILLDDLEVLLDIHRLNQCQYEYYTNRCEYYRIRQIQYKIMKSVIAKQTSFYSKFKTLIYLYFIFNNAKFTINFLKKYGFLREKLKKRQHIKFIALTPT